MEALDVMRVMLIQLEEFLWYMLTGRTAIVSRTYKYPDSIITKAGVATAMIAMILLSTIFATLMWLVSFVVRK